MMLLAAEDGPPTVVEYIFIGLALSIFVAYIGGFLIEIVFVPLARRILRVDRINAEKGKRRNDNKLYVAIGIFCAILLGMALVVGPLVAFWIATVVATALVILFTVMWVAENFNV